MSDKDRRFFEIVNQMRALFLENGSDAIDKGESLAQAAEKLAVADISELIVNARRYRNRKLGARLFGEPAWDMLLQLHLAHYRHHSISVSAVVTFGDTPPTTGLRWLKTLEAEGLVERRADPDDDRRSFVALTAWGVSQLDEYLEDFRSLVSNQGRMRRL